MLPKRACLSHTEQGQFQASHPSLWVLFLVGGGVGVARSLFLIPCVVSLGLLGWQLGSVSPPTTRRPQCPWVRPLLLHKCPFIPGKGPGGPMDHTPTGEQAV